MTELPIIVCRVESPEGPKDYLTCLSHEQAFQHGLPAEAIIGVLTRPLEPGEAITPSVFARNRVFVEFLHSVIARRGPATAGMIAEAKRQGEGWVYIIDQRTPTPQGGVPPEDILGAFKIENGQVVPDSYSASPKHQILSANGFFRLGHELQPCLLDELAALTGRANP